MTKNPTKPEPSAVPAAKPYDPTAREQEALKAYYDHHKERKNPAPRVKLTVVGKVGNLDFDHPDPELGPALLRQALGSADSDFVAGLIMQLANAGSKGGKVNEADLNFTLSVIKSIDPTDQIEVMLGAQMAAVHKATMTFAGRLANVDNIPQQDSAANAFIKLTRTFAAQVEALKRYRTGGEQKVTVQHVNVSEGGQAIVGNVTHQGGGGVAKTEDQPHASERSIAPASGETMPSPVEAEWEPVPITGRKRA